jgi:CheY-like chemotaxis protein
VTRRFQILAAAVIAAGLLCLVAKRAGDVEPRTSQPALNSKAIAQAEEAARQRAAYQRQTEERVAALASLANQQRLRAELEEKQRDKILDLQRARALAWSTILATNWPAYLALKQQAAASSSKTAPCTICDGRGLMTFCVLCDHSGKCIQCGGSGRTFGDPCPACRGTGKCYLCFGTGKMPCLFCDDGTVYLKGPAPRAQMPIPAIANPPQPQPKPPAESLPLAGSMNAAEHYSSSPTAAFERADPGSSQADESSTSTSNQVGLAVALLLGGALLVRNLGPRLANYFNGRSDPWMSSAAAASVSGTATEEDESFSGLFSAFLSKQDAGAPGDSLDPAALLARQPGPEQGLNGNADALGQFYLTAPEKLARLRVLFAEFTSSSDSAARQRVLADFSGQLESFKTDASLPELLPLLQMAWALEGLLKQMSDKGENVTLSTLRTVAGAMALLPALSGRGVRAGLVTDPPVRILAVDDDHICIRALCFALKKAFNNPDLAGHGETALGLALAHSYDAIFLDVEMPGMDGFELCTKIHQTVANRDTSVIFVTGHSDFEARSKSTLSGGNDLIAKPFLSFEIVVKALTMLMRKRLGPGSEHSLALAPPPERRDSTPAAQNSRKEPAHRDPEPPTKTAAGVTSSSPGRACSADSSANGKEKESRAIEDHAEAQARPAVAPTPAQSDPPSSADPEARSGQFAKAFLVQAPADIERLRKQIDGIRDAAPHAQADLLGELYIAVHSLAAESERAELRSISRLCSALETVCRKVLEKTERLSASVLVAMDGALQLLQDLCASPRQPDLADRPVRILVVDDDPIARRALASAIQLIFAKPDSAESGEAAVAQAGETAFDLIFMDVLMPGMDGFNACTSIRQMADHQQTPVVFVTSQSDPETRAKAVEAGGSGFISKPALAAEITLTALTFCLRGRLGPRARQCEEAARL